MGLYFTLSLAGEACQIVVQGRKFQLFPRYACPKPSSSGHWLAAVAADGGAHVKGLAAAGADPETGLHLDRRRARSPGQAPRPRLVQATDTSRWWRLPAKSRRHWTRPGAGSPTAPGAPGPRRPCRRCGPWHGLVRTGPAFPRPPADSAAVPGRVGNRDDPPAIGALAGLGPVRGLDLQPPSARAVEPHVAVIGRGRPQALGAEGLRWTRIFAPHREQTSRSGSPGLHLAASHRTGRSPAPSWKPCPIEEGEVR